MLHDITMLLTQYLHNLHHLQAMMMIVSKLYQIFTSKYQKLAEKSTYLAEFFKENFTSWSLRGLILPMGFDNSHQSLSKPLN